jgi:hypothetical protein
MRCSFGLASSHRTIVSITVVSKRKLCEIDVISYNFTT